MHYLLQMKMVYILKTLMNSNKTLDSMKYKVLYYKNLNIVTEYYNTIEEVKNRVKGLDNIYNAPILLVKDDITGYYQLCSEIA